MLSSEENELLTRVGPGTAMGNLFRRYWIPTLLAEEIPEPDGAPVRVRLLGEDLVAFRDTRGRIGLLDEHCVHRGTSLFFGRNEECGLRCIYHGWKYDIEGNILDTPAEPPDSQLKHKVHQTAYPCVEAGGMVFAYMGPKDKMPVFPAYDWLGVPQNQIYIAKSLLECNYLQALDGDCDSSHLNFLHRMFKPDERRSFLVHDHAPEFEIDEMEFGFRVAAIRKTAPDMNYVRISHFVMPFIGCVPVGREIDGKLDGFKAVYQVPADDRTTWRYDFFFKWSRPMTKEDSSKRDFVGPGYRKIRNLANRYLQDRQVQKTVNFTGIEEFLNQDACATESMGPIVDRTKEHLGVSDSYIIQVRRFLLKALREVASGEAPPGVIYDPAKADFSGVRCDIAHLPAGISWRTLFEGKLKE
ncbi:MAG TPA: Rieske 2Fe-2S domain-containing protein [Verrucomicrobiae bacterium]|nr:Rieske 2Fe-2S domain-containing protein [Verrucomicrobiae bacterium]